MKTLELNQMEEIEAGQMYMTDDEVNCRMGIGMSAIVGGILFGPVGIVIGSLWGAYFNC